MSIVPLNIGSAPNDGNGQDLRSGGQVINANFAELDQRAATAQAAAEGAKAKADAAIPATQKGQPNGVAGLDANGTVPAVQLPSYVDDVLEFGSFATLPATGETGKIYITIDNNNQYRWSGTQYVLLTASPGSTDAVPEGAVNKYWTLARTLGSVLTGLVTTNPAVIAATDTIIGAFGKLQKQITDLAASVSNKANKGANSDITSLSGLTTPLSVDQGGTGSATGTAVFTGSTAVAAGEKGLVRAPQAGEQNKVLLGGGAWGDAPLMIGASSTTAGSRGSVPPPAIGDQNKVLSGGGTWIDPPSGGADAILYPNGGTEAAPANATVGARYTLTNPWGTGIRVIAIAEILVGGEWGTTGWVGGSTSGYGVQAAQRDNGNIIVTVGGAGTYAGSSYAGGSINVTGNGTVTAAVPCRVKLWKVK